MKGDFIDAIYNCPFEMHELVTDEDISKAIFALKDVQKELLYQLVIRGYSCQIIAAFREQTDRNIPLQSAKGFGTAGSKGGKSWTDVHGQE